MAREVRNDPPEERSMVTARSVLDWIHKQTKNRAEQRMLCDLLIASEIIEVVERLTRLVETRLK